MMTALLLYLPLLGALLTAFIPKEWAKKLALGVSILSFGVALYWAGIFLSSGAAALTVDMWWMEDFGISFKLVPDGISVLLVLMTNLLIPIIILSSFKKNYDYPAAFYALILAMHTGLLGVFLAADALLFYVFWEVALIPIYFICAYWGGADRIKITFKFFIYTIVGSFVMLFGILYVYLKTPLPYSFSHSALSLITLSSCEQWWLFWAFFLAFAIKIPMFPFHSWQPDTYRVAPTTGTMLLSGIMLKMGLFGIFRWILPLMPQGFVFNAPLVISLAVVGVLYGGILAIKQDNLKKLIAFSSMSHVGLITAGIFSMNLQGMQGAVIQMINHGINAVGIFFVADIIISRLGTEKISEMGGLIKKAPVLSVFFVIIMLGNVALPLTNGFPGELLLLSGLFQYNFYLAGAAGLTVIIGAVYMLRMYKNVMLGSISSENEAKFYDVTGYELAGLLPITALIIGLGIYPQLLLDISEPAVSVLTDSLASITMFCSK